jgi:hypothetical protein
MAEKASAKKIDSGQVTLGESVLMNILQAA